MLMRARFRIVEERWLLGQVSQGAVLWDQMAIIVKRIARGHASGITVDETSALRPIEKCREPMDSCDST